MKDFKSTDYLVGHIKDIMSFYHPICMDYKLGGYVNQLRDDGSVFDWTTKHLVGTCRFIYNFSLASIILKRDDYCDAASHGIAFLREHHKQSDGGYAWVLDGLNVKDATRHCYGHAFVLLAAAGGKKAGAVGADDLLQDIWTLLENRFWDPNARLYVDEIQPGDWSAIDPYRGQNANMHMCEAMLSAYEATDDTRYLDRAELLAERICIDLANEADGLIWEHYQTDWSHDWNYNLDDPKNLFRPYGYLPGHFAEWSKLLLILYRYRPSNWLIPKAEFLFNTAMERAWDVDTGAINYSYAPDNRILDTDQYYWVFSEAFAAAALLAMVTNKDEYWNWYERIWTYADSNFVDHRYGGWYRLLNKNGDAYSDEKSPASKTDYHPLAACYEVLESQKHAS